MKPLALLACLLLLGCSSGNSDPDPDGGGGPDRSQYEGDCVFCWLNDRGRSAPVWDMTSGGMAPRAGDNREVIVIDETFVVLAGDTYTFDDQIVWVRPQSRADIEIYGTLILRDSLMLWDQTEHQQTRLRIKFTGRLETTNSYAFSHNPFWVNWEYEDGATIVHDGFVGDVWTVLHGAVDYTSTNFSTVKLTLLNDTAGTTVDVTDAHHLWLEVIPPQGAQVDIIFPPKREWVDWTIDTMWPDTTVIARDSYLYERDMSLSNDTHVTVRDTPSGFSVGWAIGHGGPGFVDCEIRDLGDPQADEGVFYQNQTWDLPCNNSSLTIIDSLFQRAWPVCWGNVHLRVFNTNLVDPRVWGLPATYEMYDSTVDHVAAYGGGRIYLENLQIRYDIEAKDLGTFVYGYNVTSRDPGSPFQVLALDGGQYIENAAPGAPW